jgi:hypothetical protein
MIEWIVNIVVPAEDETAVHDLVAGWTLSPGCTVLGIYSAQPIAVVTSPHPVDDQGNVGPMQRSAGQPSIVGPPAPVPHTHNGGTTP